jgi:hypothetical protein
MLDLVFLTCFIIVVTVLWVFSNIVNTVKSLKNDLITVNKQLERLKIELEKK